MRGGLLALGAAGDNVGTAVVVSTSGCFRICTIAVDGEMFTGTSSAHKGSQASGRSVSPVSAPVTRYE